MKVKICGITSINEAEYLNNLSVDYVGMVLFFEKSKRNISISKASDIVAALSPSIKKVAVVVSPTFEQLSQLSKIGFDYVQIHGKISSSLLTTSPLKIIKALNPNDLDDYNYYSSFNTIVAFLFDGFESGSGQVFDWSLIKKVPRNEKLFFLAGGLHSDNVFEAISIVNPDGVDVSSGVEFENKFGKDPEKVHAFIANAKKLV